MRIFDAHCDVLYKMWMDPSISFKDSPNLQVTLNGLKQYPKSIQCFAVYIPEHVPHDQRFQVSLEMIDIFYEEIIKPNKEMKFIKSKHDIDSLGDSEIGAMLSLEGCDAIGHDVIKLKTLFRLGVTSVGLTWNYANAVADGALEERGAGLTGFGREVIKAINKQKAWTDLSHLCEKSFWDAIEIADYPVATHSNVYSLVPHPRNLKDEQIRAIIEKQGIIGMAFVPQFLDKNSNAEIANIINHIDHICALGGEDHIGLGSDFDGTDQMVKGISSYMEYDYFINELLKYYSQTQVQKFCYKNFIKFYAK